MSDALKVRRQLYESLRATRARRRGRRATLMQIALLSDPRLDDEGGTAGVREPRRPLPPDRPLFAARPLP